MPSRAATPAPRRGTLTREAARRQAVTMLQIIEATSRYAAAQLNNGIGPAEARQTALEVAAELELVAGELRALAKLSVSDRRALAAKLTADGLSQRAVARRLGVSKRRTWDYLHARP